MTKQKKVISIEDYQGSIMMNIYYVYDRSMMLCWLKWKEEKKIYFSFVYKKYKTGT